MRPLHGDETKAFFEKLANYIGSENIGRLLNRTEGSYVFMLHKGRINDKKLDTDILSIQIQNWTDLKDSFKNYIQFEPIDIFFKVVLQDGFFYFWTKVTHKMCLLRVCLDTTRLSYCVERVYYVSEMIAKHAASCARENLISLGVCFGKFTKSKKFRLQITALDYLAPYAQYKVWVKPSSEQSFLYGNHILKENGFS